MLEAGDDLITRDLTVNRTTLLVVDAAVAIGVQLVETDLLAAACRRRIGRPSASATASSNSNATASGVSGKASLMLHPRHCRWAAPRQAGAEAGRAIEELLDR